MVTLAAYLHRIDPFAIEFPADFPIDGIRWYGLSYLLGFFIAYLLLRHIAKRGRTTLKPENVGDLIVTLAIGVVVGGRLGYALFYKPELFVTFSDSFPWWNLLALNQGGMASHGGMIGGIAASYYFAFRHKHSWPHLLDLFAFGAPLGLFFGRIANFINGELYGRATSPDFPLAVKFPQELGSLYRDNPVEIELAIRRIENLGHFKPYGDADRIHAIVDLIQRGNQQVIAVIEPLLTPRHPSQLYEAVLEGLVLFAVLAIVWMKPRKPGIIGAWFALTYGVVRILGEQFREPDDHIGFDAFNLTRGQWLSIGLVLVGVVLLWTMSRRPVEKMGGWK